VESSGGSLILFLVLVAGSLAATIAAVIRLYRRGRVVPPPDLHRTLPHGRV
jgi:hypothetical protein